MQVIVTQQNLFCGYFDLAKTGLRLLKKISENLYINSGGFHVVKIADCDRIAVIYSNYFC